MSDKDPAPALPEAHPENERDRMQLLTAEIEKLVETRALEKARFRSLIRVSTILSSTLNLPRLLEIILEATTRLTDTMAASILLIDSQSGNLYFEAASNIPPAQMERIQVPLKGSIAGWVVRHGEPRIIQQVKEQEGFTASARIDSITIFTTHSVLAVPLTAKGKVIGVLEALNKNDERPFSDDDADTLMAMAGQAAIAIENARLFQQNDFVSEMVHELRTPLTAMVALSELLTRPEVSAAQLSAYANTIQSEARRLTELTSELLELSRIESGRVHLKRQSIDLATLIQEIISFQGQLAAERGITIRTHLPDDPPPLVGDRDRIKQVLLNLVNNAIKYNRQNGQIHITALAESQSVQVCVQDTGRGIPSEALGHLFERFYRVPDDQGYTTGTGLGLSIAKQIIQQHGGRIWVESTYGSGSRFCFVLPTDSAEQPTPLALEADY